METEYSVWGSLARETPLFSFKNLLEEKSWKLHEVDGSVIAIYDLPWDRELDPFGVLDSGGSAWKVFWRSKDSKEIRLGLGGCMVVREDPESHSFKLANIPGLRFYGGKQFYQDKPGNFEFWGEMAEGVFILPSVEWRIKESGETRISIRVRLPTNPSEDQVTSALWNCLRDILPFTLMKPYDQKLKSFRVENVPDYETWSNMVNKAKEGIARSDFDKVVLSRSKRVKFEGSVAVGGLLKQLADINEDSYLFAILSPSGAAFMGRSPERLLSWNGDKIQVEAIAGTRRRGDSEAEYRRVPPNAAAMRPRSHRGSPCACGAKWKP